MEDLINLTISEKKGEFNIPTIIRVNNETTADEFLSVLDEKYIEYVNENNEIITCRLKKINFKLNSIFFRFVNNKINHIDISIYDEKNVGWENWSIESIKKDLDTQNQWLKKNLSSAPIVVKCGDTTRTNYKFDWGTIESGYDPRDGRVAIDIDYYDKIDSNFNKFNFLNIFKSL